MNAWVRSVASLCWIKHRVGVVKRGYSSVFHFLKLQQTKLGNEHRSIQALFLQDSMMALLVESQRAPIFEEPQSSHRNCSGEEGGGTGKPGGGY